MRWARHWFSALDSTANEQSKGGGPLLVLRVKARSCLPDLPQEVNTPRFPHRTPVPFAPISQGFFGKFVPLFEMLQVPRQHTFLKQC